MHGFFLGIWRHKMCQVLCFHSEPFSSSSSPKDPIYAFVFLSSHGWVLARDKENMTEKGWRIHQVLSFSHKAFYHKPLCCPLVVLCDSSACNILKDKPVLPLRNDKCENYVFGTQRSLWSTVGRECSAHRSQAANHARICIMSSGATLFMN